MISDSVFNLHRVTRETLLKYLEKYSMQQLIQIPQGFNNSILWNIAHCVVTQQILCYKLSGNDFRICGDWVEKYKKGTKPDASVPSEQEFQQIKDALLLTQKQLEQDYKSGFFKEFVQYPTSYGFELKSIEDAISFNNLHEGMHLGIIKSLAYFV